MSSSRGRSNGGDSDDALLGKGDPIPKRPLERRLETFLEAGFCAPIELRMREATITRQNRPIVSTNSLPIDHDVHIPTEGTADQLHNS